MTCGSRGARPSQGCVLDATEQAGEAPQLERSALQCCIGAAPGGAREGWGGSKGQLPMSPCPAGCAALPTNRHVWGGASLANPRHGLLGEWAACGRGNGRRPGFGVFILGCAEQRMPSTVQRASGCRGLVQSRGLRGQCNGSRQGGAQVSVWASAQRSAAMDVVAATRAAAAFLVLG